MEMFCSIPETVLLFLNWTGCSTASDHSDLQTHDADHSDLQTHDALGLQHCI